MSNEPLIRPPITIRIFGPDDAEAPIVIDVPELVIENPYPAERLEPHDDNEEN
jgi:hypothetical protein